MPACCRPDLGESSGEKEEKKDSQQRAKREDAGNTESWVAREEKLREKRTSGSAQDKSLLRKTSGWPTLQE